MIKRRMKAVSLGLCMALAVSACGSEPATEDTVTESPATEAVTTAATEASSGDAGDRKAAVGARVDHDRAAAGAREREGRK